MFFDDDVFLFVLIARCIELIVFFVVSYYTVKYFWILALNPIFNRYLLKITNWHNK